MYTIDSIPSMIQKQLAPWAKDEFSLAKVPTQSIIFEILKRKMSIPIWPQDTWKLSNNN